VLPSNGLTSSWQYQLISMEPSLRIEESITKENDGNVAI
jgi:hypothetical protein